MRFRTRPQPTLHASQIALALRLKVVQLAMHVSAFETARQVIIRSTTEINALWGV